MNIPKIRLPKHLKRTIVIPLILVMIPIIVLSTVTIRKFYAAVEDQTITSMQNTVEERISVLRNFFDSARREGYELTQNPLAQRLIAMSNDKSLYTQEDKGFINVLDNGDTNRASIKKSLKGYLYKIVNESNLYENIFFLDKKGNFIIDALDDSYKAVDFKKMNFFSSALRGNRLIEDVVTSPYSYRPVIIIGNPVFDEENRIIGVAGTVLKFEALSSKVIKRRNSTDYDYGIINNSGIVLAHTSKDFSIDSYIPSINDSLKKVFNKMKELKPGYTFYTLNGNKKAIAFNLLPEKNWFLFCDFSVNKYLAPAATIRNVVILILFVSLFIAGLVIRRTTQLIASNKQYSKALEELSDTQSQLIMSEKMAALGGLVAGIAHEINTPVGIGVTAVSHLKLKTDNFYELYKKNSLKKSDLEKYIETSNEATGLILSNLQRASALIQSFKKIAVDQSSDVKRVFNLREYIEEIVMSLRPVLKKTPHTVKIDCSNKIVINSYPGAFSQIISNFIINSINHAYDNEGVEPQNKKSGNMLIRVTKKDDLIVLKYTDDGKGIDKSIIDKIYDPFFTTKRSAGGSGLGLNIVYNIVKSELKGNIRCKSTPGKGTEFTVAFPYED